LIGAIDELFRPSVSEYFLSRRGAKYRLAIGVICFRSSLWTLESFSHVLIKNWIEFFILLEFELLLRYFNLECVLVLRRGFQKLSRGGHTLSALLCSVSINVVTKFIVRLSELTCLLILIE